MESIVRDLIEAAILLVKETERRRVQEHAEARANDRLLDLLLPVPPSAGPARGWFDPTGATANPPDEEAERRQRTREKLRTRLEAGDVIITGTTGGVGAYHKPPLWMKPGDTVEVEISGIGTLRNPVAQEE